ncbi:MAG TPA: Dam family site-specific DNA-(adenine-N6)-methyltransferase [Trichocoleus sp.]
MAKDKNNLININRVRPWKWAGCKKWLAPIMSQIWEQHSDRRWFDPFCGSGALPFLLEPRQALLADANPYLICSYEWVRAGAKRTIDFEMNQARYYELRSEFNQRRRNFQSKGDRLWLGEALWLLNRSCHSGLWRTNGNGQFNVGFGFYKKLSNVDFAPYIEMVKQWDIRHSSFRKSWCLVKPEDFLFLDPPYSEKFVSYTQDRFPWSEQVELAKRAADHAGPVVICNSATWSIVDLYSTYGFEIFYLQSDQHIRQGLRKVVHEVFATRNIKVSCWGGGKFRSVPDSLAAIPRQLMVQL